MSEFIPSHIGPFTILRVLGRGGMGLVCEGVDPESGRHVAIKTILAHHASEPSIRKRFEAEMDAMIRLNHPNIVRILGCGIAADGDLFYVMEMIHGMNLEHAVPRGKPILWMAAVKLVLEICKGLKAAHDRGIIHRDLKPANVLCTPEGRVLITDFGIARLFGSENETMSGAVLGTAEYMSSEQARGERPDVRTDLYAVGGILYRLIAGRPPLVGRNVTELLHKQRETVPDPLRTYTVALPSELDMLVSALLEKDRTRRPASVLALSRQLTEILQQYGQLDFPPLRPSMPSGERAPSPPSDAVARMREPERKASGAGHRADIDPNGLNTPATPESEDPNGTLHAHGNYPVNAFSGLPPNTGGSSGYYASDGVSDDASGEEREKKQTSSGIIPESMIRHDDAIRIGTFDSPTFATGESDSFGQTQPVGSPPAIYHFEMPSSAEQLPVTGCGSDCGCDDSSNGSDDDTADTNQTFKLEPGNYGLTLPADKVAENPWNNDNSHCRPGTGDTVQTRASDGNDDGTMAFQLHKTRRAIRAQPEHAATQAQHDHSTQLADMTDRPVTPRCGTATKSGTVSGQEEYRAIRDTERDRLTLVDTDTNVQAWKTPQTWVIIAVLLALLGGGAWMMRPPTADRLASQIDAIIADEPDSGVAMKAEEPIQQFLARFPDDPRCNTWREYLNEIELFRLERRLDLRARQASRRGEPATPLQLEYLRAVTLAKEDPARGAAYFESLLRIYADRENAESDDGKCYTLLKRQHEKYTRIAAQQETIELAELKRILLQIEELSMYDPIRARKRMSDITEIYADRPWAVERIAEMNKRL